MHQQSRKKDITLLQKKKEFLSLKPLITFNSIKNPREKQNPSPIQPNTA
jgi:hypothetical protein